MPESPPGLNAAQRAFLESIATRIPHLLEAIRLGNQRSEYILGRRQIRGRQVRLILVAEVVDAGANPLASHSGRTTATDRHDPALHPQDGSGGVSITEHDADDAKA